MSLQMEIDDQPPESTQDLLNAISTRPPKRKEPPGKEDFPPGTFNPTEGADVTKGAADLQGEYETGRVICESCAEGISFRDEITGGFTVKHWDAHRLECPNAAQQSGDPALYSPDTQADTPSQPQAKRRRAKRSEEERIDYLRSDPYVAQFEAYRVLCASCDKWIRLRPNSTYCSIPWDAHRKSCLAKRVGKTSYVADDHSSVFANDPHVRKFDAERVLCDHCEKWVSLGTEDSALAVRAWMQHRAECLQDKPAASTAPATSSVIPNIPKIDSVPPPSRHLMALVSSSALSAPALSTAARPQSSRTASTSTIIPPASPSAFKDFTPTNFPPAHESRRRNAEQRASALRSDPLVGEVEPNRVFCSLCQKWVQLRQDSSYCAYPWLQHRGKCLNRHQRRSQKEAESSEYKAQIDLEAPISHPEDEDDDSDEPESEEGVESGNEEEKEKRKAARREEKRKTREIARATRKKKEEERKALLSQKGQRSASMDSDFVDEPPRLADLDTPSGRLEFALKSVQYLFKSTYEGSDDLTIAALVTYLNAAMPPDKHEDFDTTEVTKVAIALQERGHFVFEGDVLRLPG